MFQIKGGGTFCWLGPDDYFEFPINYPDRKEWNSITIISQMLESFKKLNKICISILVFKVIIH